MSATAGSLTVAERLAVVLAGGGVAGIAWETGFLLGVQDEEPAAAADSWTRTYFWAHRRARR